MVAITYILGNILTVSLGITLLLAPSAAPLASRCSQDKDDRVCYFSISNHSDSLFRQIDILVDPEDFTEARLRKLMDQLRQMYSEPTMYVFLYSNVEQLSSMNNMHIIRDRPPEFSAPNWLRKYPSGVLIYQGLNQVIRYNRPGEELRTVVVQGVDPIPVRN